jgi:hypothetical protein
MTGFVSNTLSRYSIQDAERVYNFIGSNARLLGLLQECYSVIAEWFGAKNLSLEVYQDPEFGESDALVITIPTKDGVDEVLRKERDFDDRYWFNFPVDVNGCIIIDFRFIEEV